MSKRRKIPRRDRSIRHAFLYINVLRTDLGITVKEITKYLNDDNYRTRDGLPYTEKQVLEIWDMRNTKFRWEYINYQKYKPQPREIEVKQVLLKVPIIPDKPKHEILIEPPGKLIEAAYKQALIEATEELNSKLQLEKPIVLNLSVPKMIKVLIKTVKKNTIHTQDLTDKTLTTLGTLLYLERFG